ncbi:cholecystokinin receptor-like [Saccostrea echinata]|uniref:cholecystokinin receptor-like n=1 Tax=Saccostrea echinata TaxID=191078 RepID=UPI002A839594|nr:cholecystokinin receptor-like [Saccostrea echinata]
MINVTEVTSGPTDIDRGNEQLDLLLTPNIVVLSLYILFGLFGNGVVFLTYSLRSNLQNQDRYFIPKLALADLFTSTICSSLAIIGNVMETKFKDRFLCIFGNFFMVSTQSVSVLLLFIISVQRYLKICKLKDMSLKTRRLTMIIIIIVCISLGIGSSLNYRKESSDRKGKMTGFRCKSVKNENVGEVILGTTLLFGTVTVIISMLVMYGKIAHKIATHIKQMKGTISKMESISEDSYKHVSNTSTKTKSRASRALTVIDDVENLALAESSIENNGYTLGKCLVPNKILHQEKRKRKHNMGHKFTLMFMLITIVFIVCYVTKTILMLLESLDTLFWDSMSDGKRAGFLFLYRIYIVNSIVNPFIYAFLDTHFSKELKKMCSY